MLYASAWLVQPSIVNCPLVHVTVPVAAAQLVRASASVMQLGGRTEVSSQLLTQADCELPHAAATLLQAVWQSESRPPPLPLPPPLLSLPPPLLLLLPPHPDMIPIPLQKRDRKSVV